MKSDKEEGMVTLSEEQLAKYMESEKKLQKRIEREKSYFAKQRVILRKAKLQGITCSDEELEEELKKNKK